MGKEEIGVQLPFIFEQTLVPRKTAMALLIAMYEALPEDFTFIVPSNVLNMEEYRFKRENRT